MEELQSAERKVIKHVQRLSFPEVIQAMQTTSSSKFLSQVTSELNNLKIPAHMRKLHPLLDDIGILRVGGRLENSLINYHAKHWIILPYRHHVTDLIISQHHQKVGHLGQEYVLSSLCQFYWIIKGPRTCYSTRRAVDGQPAKGKTNVRRFTIHISRRGLLWTLLCASRPLESETLWVSVCLLALSSEPLI